MYTSPSQVPILEEVVARLDAALVIVDPLVAFLDRRLSSANDQDVRRALASLRGVGERTGAALVAVRHLNKTSGSNPLYRGGGSIGIIGAARGGLLLAVDPDDRSRRILAVSKGNFSQPPASLAFRLVPVPGTDVARVAWEGESPWSAADLLHATTNREQASTLAAVRAWLRQVLAAGPRPAIAMQEEANVRGFSPFALKQARRAEGILALKSRTANGAWSWALPGQASEEAHPTPTPSPSTSSTSSTSSPAKTVSS